MENVKRFIFVTMLFAVSMVCIHTSKAPEKISLEIQAVCFPIELATTLNADEALKHNAQIAYDTAEPDTSHPSYRCYISFPKEDVVCTPKDITQHQDLQTCPAFPALIGENRICYFLNKKHHSLAKLLIQKEPRLQMQDVNGVIAASIAEAKNIFLKKNR